MKKISLIEILTLLWSVFPIGEGSKQHKEVRSLPYPPFHLPSTMVVDGLDTKPFFKLTEMTSYEFITLWDSVARFLPQKGRRNSANLRQLVKSRTNLPERYITAMLPASRVKFHELAVLGFIANETQQDIDFTDGAHIAVGGMKLGVSSDGQVITSAGHLCSRLPARDYKAYLSKPIPHPKVAVQDVFYHETYQRALVVAKRDPDKYKYLPTLVLLMNLHFVNFFEFYRQAQQQLIRNKNGN